MGWGIGWRVGNELAVAKWREGGGEGRDATDCERVRGGDADDVGDCSSDNEVMEGRRIRLLSTSVASELRKSSLLDILGGG